LPEYVFESVVENLQGDREVSANFRHVCRAWREAHDRTLTVLKPKGSPPDAGVWKKFEGVKTMDLNGAMVNEGYLRALAPLTATLASLDLSGCTNITNEGFDALAPLTAITSLDLAGCKRVTDTGLNALASLTALTSLDLAYCNKVTNKGAKALAPLTALTSLNLCNCDKFTNEGVRELAPLTALASLSSDSCRKVTTEGLRAFTALTSLNLASCCVTDEEIMPLAPLRLLLPAST
jgi:hypothetical protein